MAVGASYRAEPPAVRAALLEATRRCPLVLEEPAPDVWLVGFGDSSVDYELLVWIDATRTPKDEAAGTVLFSVWEALTERGNVRSVDDGVLERLRG